MPAPGVESPELHGLFRFNLMMLNMEPRGCPSVPSSNEIVIKTFRVYAITLIHIDQLDVLRTINSKALAGLVVSCGCNTSLAGF